MAGIDPGFHNQAMTNMGGPSMTSLADDVAHTRRILALHDGPVILAPPASAGLVYAGGFGGLTEDAFASSPAA
jgi:hypothetical protein